MTLSSDNQRDVDYIAHVLSAADNEAIPWEGRSVFAREYFLRQADAVLRAIEIKEYRETIGRESE